jgi:hypothetical protein
MSVANTAAGMLVIIGALLAVLGVFAGGEVVWTMIGLVAILAGGGLSAVASRQRA